MEKGILAIGTAHSGLAPKLQTYLQGIANPGTKVTAVNTEKTPTLEIPRIACWVDEYLCGIQAMKIVAQEQGNYDGIMLAGFADAGLDGCREIAKIPVLGIAETSQVIACLLSHKFSILSTTRHRVPHKERRARALGLDSRLASIRVATWPPNDDAARITVCAELVKKCVEEDGAEAVILGGGGFFGFAKAISEKAGNICPVIEPVPTTFKVLEALIDVGLSHSKAGMWEKLIPSMLGTRKYIRPFAV
jgi:allantoin racemase